MMDQTTKLTVNISQTGGEPTNNTIKSLNASMKEVVQTTPGMTRVLGDMKSELKDIAGNAGPGATKVLDSLGIALKNPIAGAVALAAALGTIGVSMAFSFKSTIDNLADLGDRLGITADQMYYLDTAVRDSGGSLEEIKGLYEKVSRSMAKSGDEAKGAGAAYERLGVSTTDASGKLVSAGQMVDRLSERWREGTQTASDYADMVTVAGKAFEGKLKSAEALKVGEEEAIAAWEKGIGITQQSIAVTGENETAQRALSGTFNAMGAMMVELVIPAFTALTTWFVKSYETGGLAAKVFITIAVATEVVVVAVKAVISVFMSLVTMFDIVASAGQTVFSGLIKAAKGDFSGALDSFDKFGKDAVSRTEQLGRDLKNTWKGTIDNSMIKRLVENDFDASKTINRKGDITKPTRGLDSTTGGGSSGSSGGDGGDSKKEQLDPILALIDGLNKQTFAQQNLNKVALIAIELQHKKYDGSSKESKQQAMIIAGLVDESNARKIVDKAIANMDRTTADFTKTLQREHSQQMLSRRDKEAQIVVEKLELDTAAEIEKLKKDHLWTLEREIELTERLAASKGKVADATDQAREKDKDWVGGMKSSLVEYKDSAENTFNQAKTVATNSFMAMENALVNFTMTGKFNFADMAKSILADIARVVAKAAMSGFFKLIVGAFGGATAGVAPAAGVAAPAFAKGGAFDNGNIIPFAKGGLVDEPTLFGFGGNKVGVSGEAGTEAIMPLSRGPDGKLGVSSNGGGSSRVTVGTINIHVEGKTNEEQAGALNAQLLKTFQNIADSRIKEARRYGNVLNPMGA